LCVLHVAVGHVVVAVAAVVVAKFSRAA